jgi:hypothetical protein
MALRGVMTANWSLISIAAGAACLAACTAEYAPLEQDPELSNAFEAVAACAGDDLQYDFNAFAASLAVASASELGRWDALADFEVSGARLRLSPTGEIRCEGWRGDSPGGCENIRAILALQGDETSSVPYHSPSVFRSKLVTWYNRQAKYLGDQQLDAARFPSTYLVQSRSSYAYLAYSSSVVRTLASSSSATRFSLDAVGSNKFQIRDQASGRCLSTGVVSSSAPATDPTAANLSIGGGADGTTKLTGTSFANVSDGDARTYWSPTAATGRVSVKWASSVRLNTVVIREIPGAIGSIGRWRLVNDTSGAQLASGNGAGTIRFAATTTSRLSFYIDSSPGVPAVAEIATYLDSAPTAPSGTPPTLREETCAATNSMYFTPFDLGNGYHGLETHAGWALAAGGFNGVYLAAYNSESSAQHWKLSPADQTSATSLPEGVYSLLLRHSGMAVAVDGGQMADGAVIEQRTYEPADDRNHWYLSRVGNVYELINRRSGKCLDLEVPSSSSSRLVQRTCTGAASQRFGYLSTGDRYAMFTSMYGRALEVPGADLATDIVLAQAASATTASQRQFALSPVAAGEPHVLSFSHATPDGPCGDYYWYDITRPNGAPLHEPQETFVQLLFAGGKQTLSGVDENPFIAQQVSGTQVAIDPSANLSGGSSGSTGSCVSTDILYDLTGASAGLCCIRYDGRAGTLRRSAWSPTTYLCQ